MPTDACQFFYDCKGCGQRLKPKTGDAARSAPTARCHARRSSRNGTCRRGDGDACDVRLPPSWVAVAAADVACHAADRTACKSVSRLKSAVALSSVRCASDNPSVIRSKLKLPTLR